MAIKNGRKLQKIGEPSSGTKGMRAKQKVIWINAANPLGVKD